MPHWAHGGDGNFVGMTDFKGGIQQAYYRAYPASFLEVGEKASAAAALVS